SSSARASQSSRPRLSSVSTKPLRDHTELTVSTPPIAGFFIEQRRMKRMAMSTSAALTTAQRKLKNLAVDAISIPTTQELYDRKIAELADAKRRLAEIVARLIKVEAAQQRRTGDTDFLYAERAKAEA